MYFDQLDGSSGKGACHQVWWRDGYLGLTTSFPLTTLRSPPPHIINNCNFRRGILIQSLEPKTQSHTSLRAVHLLGELTSIPSSLACPSSLTWNVHGRVHSSASRAHVRLMFLDTFHSHVTSPRRVLLQPLSKEKHLLTTNSSIHPEPQWTWFQAHGTGTSRRKRAHKRLKDTKVKLLSFSSRKVTLTLEFWRMPPHA